MGLFAWSGGPNHKKTGGKATDKQPLSQDRLSQCLAALACCISRKAGCNQQRLWLLTLEALAGGAPAAPQAPLGRPESGNSNCIYF